MDGKMFKRHHFWSAPSFVLIIIDGNHVVSIELPKRKSLRRELRKGKEIFSELTSHLACLSEEELT